MKANFKGSKTSKEQSIEQALRRLKYLHTSLVPHEAFSRQNGRSHKVDERILTTKGLQSSSEERFKRTKRTSEKQCFLSLQPKTSRLPGEKTNSKTRVVKRKQDKKALRTGRAPLQTYRVPSSASAVEEQPESKNENVIISRDAVGRERNIRALKSASSALCTSDPYGCLHRFTNGFGDNTRNKKVTKEYFTNMRINRVTFSARPSSKKSTKSMNECKIEIPKSCFFNGWGVRSKKEHSPRAKTSDDYRRLTAKGAVDVTVGLRTLRLEAKRIQQGNAEETIPQPPPTPVRQIDIRLPQGMVLKYQLSEDE